MDINDAYDGAIDVREYIEDLKFTLHENKKILERLEKAREKHDSLDKDFEEIDGLCDYCLNSLEIAEKIRKLNELKDDFFSKGGKATKYTKQLLAGYQRNIRPY